MTKLEQEKFENWAKFQLALEKIVNKEEAFRTYKNKDKENVKKKIISNGRLYLGNNYSININKADDGQVYISVDYFSADDRISISKNKKGFKSADEI